MLVITELAEALECDRDNKTMGVVRASTDAWKAEQVLTGAPMDSATFKEYFELTVKDTLEDEIADAFIRLLTLAGRLSIDIHSRVVAKRVYNSLRPERHGKTY